MQQVEMRSAFVVERATSSFLDYDEVRRFFGGVKFLPRFGRKTSAIVRATYVNPAVRFLVFLGADSTMRTSWSRQKVGKPISASLRAGKLVKEEMLVNPRQL